MSPTQRSLAELRKRGYLADVTERWMPRARVRKDLYGFIDILAIFNGEMLGIQATSGSHVADRIKKIRNHENFHAVMASPIEVWVWGWRKNAKGRWVLREEKVE